MSQNSKPQSQNMQYPPRPLPRPRPLRLVRTRTPILTTLHCIAQKLGAIHQPSLGFTPSASAALDPVTFHTWVSTLKRLLHPPRSFWRICSAQFTNKCFMPVYPLACNWCREISWLEVLVWGVRTFEIIKRAYVCHGSYFAGMFGFPFVYVWKGIKIYGWLESSTH